MKQANKYLLSIAFFVFPNAAFCQNTAGKIFTFTNQNWSVCENASVDSYQGKVCSASDTLFFDARKRRWPPFSLLSKSTKSILKQRHYSVYSEKLPDEATGKVAILVKRKGVFCVFPFWVHQQYNGSKLVSWFHAILPVVFSLMTNQV